MEKMTFKTKSGKSLYLTVHAQERQIERDLLKIDLQAALDRAITINRDNAHKYGMYETFRNKMASYDQNHIQIIINPYYNVQFRVDTTNGNIVTLIKYKNQ